MNHQVGHLKWSAKLPGMFSEPRGLGLRLFHFPWYSHCILIMAIVMLGLYQVNFMWNPNLWSLSHHRLKNHQRVNLHIFPQVSCARFHHSSRFLMAEKNHLRCLASLKTKAVYDGLRSCWWHGPHNVDSRAFLLLGRFLLHRHWGMRAALRLMGYTPC